MAIVLKIASQGNVHRVRLETAPTFDSLDALLNELYPKAGAAGACHLARYTDEDGDACLLTAATFTDFLETARTTGGGVCPVLRLEVLPPPTSAHALEEATDAEAGAAKGGMCRLRAAGCLPRAEGGSSAASPADSWLCIDAARDRGSCDSSWAWASCKSGSGSGKCSERRPPSPESEGSWVELDSRAASNERTQEESGPSEASFEPTALNLAELHADDWESSASGCSESEPTAKAQHLLLTAVGSDQARPCAVASTKEVIGEEEGEASEKVVLSSLQPYSAAAEAVAALTAEAPKLASTAQPQDSKAVEAAEGTECMGQHAQFGWLDMKAGVGSAASLPCGARAPVHTLEEKLPAAIAPPPVASAAGRCRPPAVATRGQRVSAAAGIKGKRVKSERPLPVRAAWQGGKAAQLDAGLDKIVHMGHICDGCEACPLPGPRFTCRVCRDFDLCWTCFMRKDQLPETHDPSHHFQQVLWSEEVASTCPGGCGYGVTSCSGHPTHCCTKCAEAPGQHTDACQAANAHDDELDP